MIKLSDIKPNKANPRIIKDERFKELKQSLQDFPKMMELRPIVVDEQNIIQGGNQRRKALMDLGYTEIPEAWVKKAQDFTEDELREFVIKDNVSFGEWDLKALETDYDQEALGAWGLDLPDPKLENKNVEFTPRPGMYKRDDFYYLSLFKAKGEMGKSLEQFKKDPANATEMAKYAAEFIGSFYRNTHDLVMVTTPRRIHARANGFHFATLCCQEISKITGIPFIEDAFNSIGFNKYVPEFEQAKEIPQATVLIVDDIITTGRTVIACRKLLEGKNVIIFPLIKNNN